MEKEKLLDCVAPCSLLCYACPSFIDGPVSECAKKITQLLGWILRIQEQISIGERMPRMAFRI